MKIMASSPITSWLTGEKVEAVTDFIFMGSKITVNGDCCHKIKRRLLLRRKAMTRLESILKNRHHFANKCPYNHSYNFSSNHVWIWELDQKEGCAPKNWSFQIVLEKTLESPLDSKEIKTVNPKGNQLNIHWKDWCWSWSSNILATWCEEATHWKRPWYWERLRAG